MPIIAISDPRYDSNMKLRYAAFLLALAVTAWPQRGPSVRTIRAPSRGTHGAIAAGVEYATEAGMRMYFSGGTAVDAGIAAMFAASVTEFSHFGMGGESPILVRTKDG
jgi:gamma-glutamyltranspeptidase